MDPEKLLREAFDKATRETGDRTFFAFTDDGWTKRMRCLTTEALKELSILQSDLADPLVAYNDKKMMFMDGDGFLALTRCYLVAVGLKDGQDVALKAVVPLDAITTAKSDGAVLKLKASRAFIPTTANPKPTRADDTRITGTSEILSVACPDAELWGKLLNKVRFWISAKEWDARTPPEMSQEQRAASENCLHAGCGKSLKGIFASSNSCPGCKGGFCNDHFGREAVTANMIRERRYEAAKTCFSCSEAAHTELEGAGLLPVLAAYRQARDNATKTGETLRVDVDALVTAATKGDASLRQARVDGLKAGWELGARARLQKEKKASEEKGYSRGYSMGKLAGR